MCESADSFSFTPTVDVRPCSKSDALEIHCRFDCCSVFSFFSWTFFLMNITAEQSQLHNVNVFVLLLLSFELPISSRKSDRWCDVWIWWISGLFISPTVAIPIRKKNLSGIFNVCFFHHFHEWHSPCETRITFERETKTTKLVNERKMQHPSFLFLLVAAALDCILLRILFRDLYCTSIKTNFSADREAEKKKQKKN